MSTHKTKRKATGGRIDGWEPPGWGSPEEELQFVIWALNGEKLFVYESEIGKDSGLYDELLRATGPVLRYFVELWDRCGRNLKQMWRSYYLECLGIHKYSEAHHIRLGWGDSNRASFIHTFLDRHGRTPDEEAARFFLTLICNSQNEKLGGPCAGCDKYFIRRTAGNTTYCSRSCGTRATAIAATRRKRAAEQDQKLQHAQAAIEQWYRERQKGRTKIDWKQWVSRSEPDITPHFLTRAVNTGKLEPPVQQ